MNTGTVYIRALRFRFLTPVYDAAMRVLFDEASLRMSVVEQVRPAAGDRILDVGCGTATLTLKLWRAAPEAQIVGLDGDPRVLAIARKKAAREGARIELREGLATRLPFPDGAFDHVVTSLVLHHLTLDDKRTALREMHRVLRPGGTLHVMDISTPQTAAQRAMATIMRHFEETRDNFAGRLPPLARDAGFDEVDVRRTTGTLVGPVALIRARRPA